MVLLTSESNNTQRAIRIARLNDDGTLTVLPSFVLLTTSSEPGPGPVVTAMWNGSTYTIAVLLKNGVNIFHFDGTTLTHTNVLPHPAASPYYSVVTPSIAPPASILLCGRANGDVDVWTGAGSGAPSNFGTAARPVNYLNGFGAWIDPLAPAVLYTYRVTTPDGLTYFLVSESWSVPGGTPPPVDPHAADLVTLKTAVAAATISTEAVAPCKTFLAAMGV
jgi:hypothetical protein